MLEHVAGEPVGLAPEEQRVPRLVAHIGVEVVGVLGERADALRRHIGHEVLERPMDVDIGVLPVVEAGPPEPGVVESEPERLDQVEPVAGVDAQQHQIPGVRGNLRVN